MWRIPERAKCVFEWFFFKVMERVEPWFDNKWHIYHRILRKDYTVVLAVDKKKELIYIWDQEQPAKWKFYNFLWWIVERWEDSFSSAKRELLEEWGFESDDWKLYKQIKFKWWQEWNAWIYIASNPKKTTWQKLDEWLEKVDVMTVTLDELIELYHTDKRKWSSDFALEMQRFKLDFKAKEEFRKELFK